MLYLKLVFMINADTYSFLNDLRLNNNKEWFDVNRKRYEVMKQNISQTAEIIIHEVSKIDKSVVGLLAKDCIFRINRDIRFSADKSPYKTNSGIYVCPGGKNTWNAGYYLHVEPNNSFLSGGVYMPTSPVLKAMREEIFNNYDEFLDIVQNKNFLSDFGELWGDKLKTKPKGFSDDFAGMEYLKFKQYCVIKRIDDKIMMSDKLLNEIRSTFTTLFPFNRFLNQAIREM
jgi:uncharacterized protein (TIGR02453 family)